MGSSSRCTCTFAGYCWSDLEIVVGGVSRGQARPVQVGWQHAAKRAVRTEVLVHELRRLASDHLAAFEDHHSLARVGEAKDAAGELVEGEIVAVVHGVWPDAKLRVVVELLVAHLEGI